MDLPKALSTKHAPNTLLHQITALSSTLLSLHTSIVQLCCAPRLTAQIYCRPLSAWLCLPPPFRSAASSGQYGCHSLNVALPNAKPSTSATPCAFATASRVNVSIGTTVGQLGPHTDPAGRKYRPLSALAQPAFCLSASGRHARRSPKPTPGAAAGSRARLARTSCCLSIMVASPVAGSQPTQ